MCRGCLTSDDTCHLDAQHHLPPVHPVLAGANQTMVVTSAMLETAQSMKLLDLPSSATADAGQLHRSPSTAFLALASLSIWTPMSLVGVPAITLTSENISEMSKAVDKLQGPSHAADHWQAGLFPVSNVTKKLFQGNVPLPSLTHPQQEAVLAPCWPLPRALCPEFVMGVTECIESHLRYLHPADLLSEWHRQSVERLWCVQTWQRRHEQYQSELRGLSLTQSLAA